MHEIETIEELDDFIINNKDYIIMLYFGATWCGPCKSLKAKLCEEETVERLSLLKVVYIDIDNAEEIASMYKIKSLPTQIFVKLYNNKVKVVSKIEGYDYTKLLLEYDNYVDNVLKKID